MTSLIILRFDIGPSDTQGLALAAGLHGKTLKDVPSQHRNKGPERKRVVVPPGSSIRCSLMWHQIKQCHKRKASPGARKEPGLCLRYRRGKHWTNKCRSKKDSQGNSLSGNEKGPSQGPRQIYGVIKQPVPPLETFAQPLLAVQGSFSNLPFTQFNS